MSAHSFENLSTESRGDGLLVVRVDRPKALNALDDQTISEIDALFASLRDDESVRGVILTGAGDRAFVAGADITQLAEQDVAEGRARALAGQRAFRRIEQLGKPVIAAINGFALGGGCELALACHIRYASAKAKIGLPEVTLGIIPGFGGTQRLSRIIGRGNAIEWMLTGEHRSATECHRVGLVSEVFDPESFLEEVEKKMRTILSRGPIALRYVLEAVSRGLDGTLDRGLEIEADLFGVISATEDVREGMKAFLEKRSAEFRGR